LYTTAVVKKKRFWPKGIDGDEIVAHMENKNVGDCEAKRGTIDNKPFYLSATKDSKFVCILMNTWGTLDREGPMKKRRIEGGFAEFRYPMTTSHYYAARHAVDDNNNLRQRALPLEKAWGTRRWDVRQFTFMLAVCEVNAHLAHNQFGRIDNAETPLTHLTFRTNLAKGLINNPYLQNTNNSTPPLTRNQATSRATHHLLTRPKFKGAWDATIQAWKDVKTEYLKSCCTGFSGGKCEQETRTYCACNPGVIYCQRHFMMHYDHIVRTPSAN